MNKSIEWHKERLFEECKRADALLDHITKLAGEHRELSRLIGHHHAQVQAAEEQGLDEFDRKSFLQDYVLPWEAAGEEEPIEEAANADPRH